MLYSAHRYINGRKATVWELERIYRVWKNRKVPYSVNPVPWTTQDLASLRAAHKIIGDKTTAADDRLSAVSDKWFSPKRLLKIPGAKKHDAAGYYCRRRGNVYFVMRPAISDAGKYYPNTSVLFDAPQITAPLQERLDYIKENGCSNKYDSWKLSALLTRLDVPALLGSDQEDLFHKLVNNEIELGAGFEENEQAVYDYLLANQQHTYALRHEGLYGSLENEVLLDLVVELSGLRTEAASAEEDWDRPRGNISYILEVPGYKEHPPINLLVMVGVDRGYTLLASTDLASVRTLRDLHNLREAGNAGELQHVEVRQAAGASQNQPGAEVAKKRSPGKRRGSARLDEPGRTVDVHPGRGTEVPGVRIKALSPTGSV